MNKKLSPQQILVVGFLSFIIIGTLLLMLPLSSEKECSLIDALFTSTSAICVTGLIVKDTSHDFTLFGQLIILILIQIGGLGYMTSATIFAIILGKKIGVTERLIMKEELNISSLGGIVKFTKEVIKFVVITEIIGTLILTLYFLKKFTFIDAFYKSLFHAISAFNNAGFSLFSDNLMHFKGDIIVNITIACLVISGSIGFIVVKEIYIFMRKKEVKLSLHTKIVLSTTAILLLSGACFIYILESTNPNTFGILSLKERMLISFFSSVTPRTAGFNTINYSFLRTATLFLTIILMFIGASPGSTGGGVKTTTFSIVLASLYGTIRGAKDTSLFRRRIPSDLVSRSFLIVTLAAIFCTASTFLIVCTQNIDYFHAMFEVTSAFSTVGLSIGNSGAKSLSAFFTPIGKLVIIFTMFAGRLGPLTLAVAVTKRSEEKFRYPEEEVMIG